MFRTRFKKQIVTEFLSPHPQRSGKNDRVIIICDGMPSIPRKQPLMEFLSGKGYWVFYPRYRGAWESDGEFLAKSPHEDILDVVDELRKPVIELSFGKRFSISPRRIYVIGGSFGGAAAILCSLDPRVTKVVANCPVVDWRILPREEKVETSNPKYAAYIRNAFGNGYRLSDRNWAKLRTGSFFNPWQHTKEVTGSKILLFHAKDDPYVPYQRTKQFAETTGAKLKSVAKGGHMRTEYVVKKYWRDIKAFFDSAAQ